MSEHGGTSALVARALAAPTRAGILDHLRAAGPKTVQEVAASSSVHANVARGHLDVLVSAGLATASWRRNASGGRPAKVYEASPVHVERGPALVADLLASLIEEFGPEPDLPKRIAEQTGASLAGRVRQNGSVDTFAEQVELLVRALSFVSGGVRVMGRGDDWVEIEDLDCPFKDIASSHPQLACQLDKWLKEGIMRGLGADTWVEQVNSVAWGDPSCREVVRWRASVPAGARA